MIRTVLVTCSCLLLTVPASAQPGNAPGQEPRRGFRGAGRDTFEPRQNRSRRGPFEEDRDINAGFIFVDGEYLETPYRISLDETGIAANGRLLEPPRHAEIAVNRSGSTRRRLMELRIALDQDGAISSWSGKPVDVITGIQSDLFLSAMLAPPEDRRAEVEHFLDALPGDAERAGWLDIVHAPERSPQFKQRASALLQAIAEAQELSQRVIAGAQVMDRFAYPLSVAGIIVVVLAVGHLFSAGPTAIRSLPDDSHMPQLKRAAVYSVSLIVAMSILDLTWTLMASSVGLMNELNPVGARLIDDPHVLIAFKATATLLAAAILISLRRRRSAQLAAWWLCIVCTLVSARWLIFNSMFMG